MGDPSYDRIAKGQDEYKDNVYEIEAEKFGQGIYKAWYRKFKKNQLF